MGNWDNRGSGADCQYHGHGFQNMSQGLDSIEGIVMRLIEGILGVQTTAHTLNPKPYIVSPDRSPKSARIHILVTPKQKPQLCWEPPDGKPFEWPRHCRADGYSLFQDIRMQLGLRSQRPGLLLRVGFRLFQWVYSVRCGACSCWPTGRESYPASARSLSSC